ncbi:MAG: ATP-binding protein [Chloroflexota bacterium]
MWFFIRKWTRPATLVSLFVSVLFSIIFIFSIQSLITTPALFLSLAEPDSETAKVEVEYVFPGGILWEFGIRPGDQVLRIDQNVPTLLDSAKSQWQRATIQDSDGNIRTIDLQTNVHKQNTLPLLLISPVFLLFGVLIFLRSEQRLISQKYFLLFVSIAFSLAISPLSENDVPIGLAMGFVTIIFFSAFFLLFLLSFPDRDVSIYSTTLIFVPPTVISLLFLLSLIYVDIYNIVSGIRFGIIFLYLSLGVLLSFHSMLSVEQSRSKQGVLIVNIGNILSMLPSILLYLLPVLLNLEPILSSEYTILSIIVMPFAFAYAILYHNILQINPLQRWFVRALIWIIVFASTSGVILLLVHALLDIQTMILFSSIVFIMFLISIGYILGKIQLKIWNFVDHLVFKDNYNYNITIQQISRDLSITSNNQILMKELVNNLKNLINTSFVVLLSKNESKISIFAKSDGFQMNYIDYLFEAVDSISTEAQVTLLPDKQGSGLLMCVTLRMKDVVLGYICIGPKINKETFRSADKNLLVTLSGQIAALIQNEQLIEDLHSKVHALDVLNERLYRTQEEERLRLSADIHDEPLQTALHLQRQLMVMSTQETKIADYAGLSQTLVDQLRRVCTEMRPAVLDDLGLHAALDALAQEQSERMGSPIILDVSMALIDTPLCSSIELVLYRVTQEAITNCVRHAHPKLVIIRLGYQDEIIYLSVEDDGVGFNVPDNLESLIEHGHLGLAGLLNRVQHMGGELTISSTLGEGTLLKVSCPSEVLQS